MSHTVVVIPLRGLHGGKSRLAPILDPTQRTALIASMAHRVVTTVANSGISESILLVTRDRDLLSHLGLVGHPMLTTVVQPGTSVGLNAALDLGRREAIARHADRLLVLPADFPTLGREDLVKMSSMHADVVLAPDRLEFGTNALMIQGRAALSGFPFRFGLDSRRLHERDANRLGLGFAECRTPGLALDLDTPGDWDMLTEETRRHLLSAPLPPRYPSFSATVSDSVALLERA